MPAPRFDAARANARALLEQLCIKRPADIDLAKIAAEHFNARVEIERLDGAEAQLVRRLDRTTITLADRITDPAAQRFNLAHELGHLALAHPTAHASHLACNPQRRRKTGVEGEASCWSGDVLLPETLVRPLCDVASVDLEIPQQIAHDFTVSILASAIRFTELTRHRCAAVLSRAGKVSWCAASATWGREIGKGTLVRPGSIAFQYFASGDLDDRAQPVAADTWLETRADAEIIEHAICSPEHNTVLSMLWIPESTADLVTSGV